MLCGRVLNYTIYMCVLCIFDVLVEIGLFWCVLSNERIIRIFRLVVLMVWCFHFLNVWPFYFCIVDGAKLLWSLRFWFWFFAKLQPKVWMLSVHGCIHPNCVRNGKFMDCCHYSIWCVTSACEARLFIDLCFYVFTSLYFVCYGNNLIFHYFDFFFRFCVLWLVLIYFSAVQLFDTLLTGSGELNSSAEMGKKKHSFVRKKSKINEREKKTRRKDQ